MDNSTIDLDPLERQLVNRATHIAVTRRRIWYSVLIPAALIVLLLLAFWETAEPRILLWLFVGYLVLGIVQRVGHGMAILAYKRIIRKLIAQLNEAHTAEAE